MSRIILGFGDGTWTVAVNSWKIERENKKIFVFILERSDSLVHRWGNEELDKHLNKKGWIEKTYDVEMVHNISPDAAIPAYDIDCNFLGEWAPRMDKNKSLYREIELLKEEVRLLDTKFEETQINNELIADTDFASSIDGRLSRIETLIGVFLTSVKKGEIAEQQ